jgi:hypothetical protein
VTDFVSMKIHVLGCYDMSTGILESEDGRSNLLWEVGKYLPINKALYPRKLSMKRETESVSETPEILHVLKRLSAREHDIVAYL